MDLWQRQKNLHPPCTLLCLLLFLIGCQPQKKNPPPIILIVFDTTRADHMSVYGYPEETTPGVAKYFSENTAKFTNMVTASNNTYCSHASIFTGLHVKSHGVSRVHPGVNPLTDSFDTLAEVLKERGYYTLGAISASHINPEYSGFGQGFEDFVICPQDRKNPKRPSEETNSDLLPALEAAAKNHGDKPLFLFLHYFDAHYRYAPPKDIAKLFPPKPSKEKTSTPSPIEGFARPPQQRADFKNLETNIARYNGEILREDQSLTKVFESLDQLGILDEAVIVLTSDHGENLGEKNLYYNHAGLYEQVIRAPLLVRIPGLKTAKTIDDLAHHTDLMPTLLDVAGVEKNDWPPMEGQSLLPRILGESTAPLHTYAYSEAVQTSDKMIRDKKHKLIVDAYLRCLLFDLESDPKEETNLVNKLPEKKEQLIEELLSFLPERKIALHLTRDRSETGTEDVFGSILTLRKPAELLPGGFTEKDNLKAATSSGEESTFHISLDPGEGKGVRIKAQHGPIFFDLYSTRSPIVFQPERLWEEETQKGPMLPIVLTHKKQGFHEEQAPTEDDPVVLIEMKEDPQPGVALYHISFLPLPEGVGSPSIRIATTGDSQNLKRLKGDLLCKILPSTSDLFRIDGRKPQELSTFALTVQPKNALVLLEAKLNRKSIPNTRFRIGDSKNPRAYPSTFAISADTLLSTPSSPEALGRVQTKPGFYLWSEIGRPGANRSTPEMVEMLEVLGYVEKEDEPLEEEEGGN